MVPIMGVFNSRKFNYKYTMGRQRKNEFKEFKIAELITHTFPLKEYLYHHSSGGHLPTLRLLLLLERHVFYTIWPYSQTNSNVDMCQCWRKKLTLLDLLRYGMFTSIMVPF